MVTGLKLSNKNILFLGANYNLIFAVKSALAGYKSYVFCTKEEAKQFKKNFYLSYNINNRKKKILINSIKNLFFSSKIRKKNYKLIFYSLPERVYENIKIQDQIKKLLRFDIPLVTLNNLPPIKTLKKNKFIKKNIKLKNLYHPKNPLNQIKSSLIAHAATEPQITKKNNTININHPGTLRISKFRNKFYQDFLDKFQIDFNNDKNISNIKIKTYKSLNIALNKLPMLIAGNYRCKQFDSYLSIKDIVNKDTALSNNIYDIVCNILIKIGFKTKELIPFKKYLKSTKSLTNISSVAKDFLNKKKFNERVDILVFEIAKKIKLNSNKLNILKNIILSNDYK